MDAIELTAREAHSDTRYSPVPLSFTGLGVIRSTGGNNRRKLTMLRVLWHICYSFNAKFDTRKLGKEM